MKLKDRIAIITGAVYASRPGGAVLIEKAALSFQNKKAD
jgi:hypothetical protein